MSLHSRNIVDFLYKKSKDKNKYIYIFKHSIIILWKGQHLHQLLIALVQENIATLYFMSNMRYKEFEKGK